MAEMIRCKFLQNKIYQRQDGSALYINQGSQVKGIDCYFEANQALVVSDLNLISSKAIFIGTTFNGSFSIISGTGSALVQGESELYMEDCTIRGYRTTGNMGSITLLSPSTILFRACLFEDNINERHGSAIHMKSLALDVFDCQFKRNSAREAGGAIFLERRTSYGNINITNSFFEENCARYCGQFTNYTPPSSRGGAIPIEGLVKVRLQNSTMIRNMVLSLNERERGKFGGAISLGYSGKLLIDSSTFAENTVQIGGAVASKGKIDILNSTFENNKVQPSTFFQQAETIHTEYAGGAIHVTLTQSPIVQNDTCLLPEHQLSDSVFKFNQALGGGGGIFVRNSLLECKEVGLVASVCLSCKFQANQAAFGQDVGTSAYKILLSDDSISANNPASANWNLSIGTSKNLSIVAYDFFNAPLNGNHEPLAVRLRLIFNELSEHYTSSIPADEFTHGYRYILNGTWTSTSLLINKKDPTSPHTSDVPMTLKVFCNTLPKEQRGFQQSIYLQKCTSEGEYLSREGTCFPLDDDSTNLMGIDALGTIGFIFFILIIVVLYISFQSKTKIVDTIKLLSGGISASLAIFIIELLDFTTDLVSVVTLFHTKLFMSIEQQTYVQILSVTCFVLAMGPSLHLIWLSIRRIRSNISSRMKMNQIEPHEAQTKKNSKIKKTLKVICNISSL